MITLKKINQEIIKPIKVPVVDSSQIKGFSLFEEPYANIFLLAKKKSGKTNTIFKILKSCVSKNTKLIIFSSTVYKDPNWTHITKYFDKNEIILHLSIKDGKINNLESALKEFQHVEKKEDENEEEFKLDYISPENFKNKNKKNKKNKPSKISPEIIFVFDDIGNELRNTAVRQLLKTNRHYKSRVIISSQYIHDLESSSIKQLDYMLIFRGYKEDKLKIIYDNLNLTINYEEYIKLYENATKDKYCFLYIDIPNGKYRKCFDKQYIL